MSVVARLRRDEGVRTRWLSREAKDELDGFLIRGDLYRLVKGLT
jgi:hypothetical protein